MARTQTLERPIHVEAPSWWRTALRYNRWLILATGVLLFGCLAYQVTPYELDTAFVVVMATALACAVGTYAWQRGQPDRYPPLLLAGMVVGLAGGLVSSVAAGRAAGAEIDLGGGNPFAAGIALLGLAAILALASLAQLFLFRREGRGRLIAAYLFVWSGYWAGVQQAWLVEAWVVIPDAVHLAVVDDHGGVDRVSWGSSVSLLSLATNGDAYLDSRSRSSKPSESLMDEEDLWSAVARFSAREPTDPRGDLLVALDGDERFGRAVTVLNACAASGRKAVMLVVRAPDSPAPQRSWHAGGILVGTGAARTVHDGEEAQPLGPMDLRLVQDESGALSFALDGGELTSYDVLLETLADRAVARDHRRVRLVASADLRWEPLMRFIDRFQAEGRTFIDGFAVAD